MVELKVKEYTEQATDPGTAVAKMAETVATIGTAAKIAADAAKKFGAAPEPAGNGFILNDKTENDKLPVQPEKSPEIENSEKLTDAAAELLDANEF